MTWEAYSLGRVFLTGRESYPNKHDQHRPYQPPLKKRRPLMVVYTEWWSHARGNSSPFGQHSKRYYFRAVPCIHTVFSISLFYEQLCCLWWCLLYDLHNVLSTIQPLLCCNYFRSNSLRWNDALFMSWMWHVSIAAMRLWVILLPLLLYMALYSMWYCRVDCSTVIFSAGRSDLCRDQWFHWVRQVWYLLFRVFISLSLPGSWCSM